MFATLQFSPCPPGGTRDTPPQSPQQQIEMSCINSLSQDVLHHTLKLSHAPRWFRTTLWIERESMSEMRKLGMCVIETLWSHSNPVDSMEPRTYVLLSSPSSTALNEALFWSATCRPFGVTCLKEHVKIHLNLLCVFCGNIFIRLFTLHSTLCRNNALDQSSDCTSWTKKHTLSFWAERKSDCPEIAGRPASGIVAE